MLAREWCLGDEAGFTAEKQGYRVMENIDKLLETWTPRKNYELIKFETPKKKYAPHNLIY